MTSMVGPSRPKTVKELRELIAQLPDNMPIYCASGGFGVALLVNQGKVGKAGKPPKIVYRGGIDSLLFS